MKILIREFKPEDVNFIISCWVKSSYKSSTGYKERLGVYHRGIDSLIKKKYDRKELLAYVACMEDDPDLLLGFVVIGMDMSLHYVYVKEAFKRQGIGTKLLDHVFKSRKEIKASFWTKDIKYIQKIYKVEYDRFRFFN